MSFVNTLTGIVDCLAASVKKSASNSKFTQVVTLIASIKGKDNCGNEISKKSNGKNHCLAVINAIKSQALHSGTKGLFFIIHIIFVISFNMFKIAAKAQNIFGSFGGGGKSGNFISGRLGRSGKSGISIIGRSGIEGRFKVTVGSVGRYKFGKVGRSIGLKLNSNSGIQIFNQALILCKSK
jgi:hypothetical protein